MADKDKYTTKEQFNIWLQAEINHLIIKENQLRTEIENKRIDLHQKLECEHVPERGVYKDYYSKIESYFCKKCHFSMEF